MTRLADSAVKFHTAEKNLNLTHLTLKCTSTVYILKIAVDGVRSRKTLRYKLSFFFFNQGCRSLLHINFGKAFGVTAQGFMMRRITRLFTFSFNFHPIKIKKVLNDVAINLIRNIIFNFRIN